jgi:hypothetical protein
MLIHDECCEHGAKPNGIFWMACHWYRYCSLETYQHFASARCLTYWPSEKPVPPPRPLTSTQTAVAKGAGAAVGLLVALVILAVVGVFLAGIEHLATGGSHGGSKPAATSRR